MKMNENNIERILDVLKYLLDHYEQTFTEDDIYATCPEVTSNIIEVLNDKGVITCKKDGVSFDKNNIEEYRSFMSDLEDNVEDLDLPVERKKEILSKTSEYKKNIREKKFVWHLYPEEPIKLHSVIEIFLFLLIFGFSYYLYYRWNIVPVREVEIEIENLGNGKHFKYDENYNKYVDSIRKKYASDIHICIPMTSHEELIKETSNIIIKSTPILSDSIYSEYIRLSFIRDSLLNVDDSKELDYKALLRKLDIYYETEDISMIKNRIDSLRNVFANSVDFPLEEAWVLYVKMKYNYPYFNNINNSRININNSDSIIGNIQTEKDYLINEFYSFKSNFTFDPSVVLMKLTVSDNSNKNRWYKLLNTLNIYYPFLANDPMQTPKWGRLEDISQAYVDIKLHSETVDSIILNIDFVGVTDFSEMDPMPDKIGMSNIIFYDPVKIHKIKQNGLLFHAQFKELENWQQIRVFTVTAIMSAFVFVFVVFLISSYFKLRNRYKGGKIDAKNITFFVIVLLFVLFLYSTLYWGIMIYYPRKISPLLCNLITIPIVFFIMALINRRTRGYILKLWNKFGLKGKVIAISLLIIITVVSIYAHGLSSSSFDELLMSGEYSRATDMIYNDIMSKEKVSKEDLTKLRKALLEEFGQLYEKKLNCRLNNDYIQSDGLFLDIRKDTLLIIDMSNNKLINCPIPGLYSYSVCDNFIIAKSFKCNYVIDRKNYKIMSCGKYDNLFVTMYSDDISFVDKSKDTLFYISFENGKMHIKKTVLPELKGYISYLVDSFMVVRSGSLDSFWIYKKMNNKLITKHKGKGNALMINKKERLIHAFSGGNDCVFNIEDSENIITGSNSYFLRNVIEEKWQWDKKSLSCLKDIISDSIGTFCGKDSSYIYFYKDKLLSAYDINTKKLSHTISVPTRPDFMKTDNGTFFTCIYGGVFIFNNKSKIMERTYSDYNHISLSDGYLFELKDEELLAFSFQNPEDTLYVSKKYPFMDYEKLGKINVMKGWAYSEKSNQITLVNIESIDTLITRNKFLSNKQKGKLIEKLKSYKEWNY